LVGFEVYCHTSPSGRRYVGFSSRGMGRRWLAHVDNALRRGSWLPFHRAIRKYGADAFTHEVLERMTTEAGAKRAEQLWIERLGSFGAGGYNATRGGEGVPGLACSEQTRAKLRAHSTGRKHTAAAREKVSVAQRGITRSAEWGRNISAALTGRQLSPAHVERIREAQNAPGVSARKSAALMGHSVSEATRRILAEKQRGRRPSAEAIAKTAAANRGRKRPPEFGAKVSAAKRGVCTPAMRAANAARAGVSSSDATRAKLRAAWARRKARA
jgi:group I intron endonuclease